MVVIGPQSLNILTEKSSPGFSPFKIPLPEKINSFLNLFDHSVFQTSSKKNAIFNTNIAFVDNPQEKPVITKATKVLILGDSQTYGNYGTKLDELVRGTDAKVITYASWGASPEWWFSGYKADKVWSKGIDGNSERLRDYNTPSLEKVLKEEKPDVVIVTMGGNMMATATQKTVSESVGKIGTAVTASGAKLFWVGPPKYDPGKRTHEQLETFYGFLAKAVESHGTLIDSRKFIDKYHGTDGLHYSGSKGDKQTVKWATGVFNEIRKTKLK